MQGNAEKMVKQIIFTYNIKISLHKTLNTHKKTKQRNSYLRPFLNKEAHSEFK